MISDSDDKKKIKDPEKSISYGSLYRPWDGNEFGLFKKHQQYLCYWSGWMSEIELEITACKTQTINAEDFPCYLQCDGKNLRDLIWWWVEDAECWRSISSYVLSFSSFNSSSTTLWKYTMWIINETGRTIRKLIY